MTKTVKYEGYSIDGRALELRNFPGRWSAVKVLIAFLGKYDPAKGSAPVKAGEYAIEYKTFGSADRALQYSIDCGKKIIDTAIS